MKKLLAWGAGILAALIIIGAIASLAADDEPVTPAKATATNPETSTAPAPTVEAKPDATYTSNCSYLLGDFTTGPSGYRFVADAQVTNTGNIGVIAELRASWRQAGGQSLTMRRRTRVPTGATRDVGVVRRVTQDNIDQIQSVSGDNCRATVTVVGTYGAAS